MWTFDLDFPDTEFGALVGAEHAVAAFVTRLEMKEGLDFRSVLGKPPELEDKVFGGDGTIAKADFGFVSFFDIAGPLDPFWFGFGEFVGGEGDHFSDVAGGGHAAAAVDGGEFEDKGIAIAGGDDAVGVGMGPIDGSGADTDGVLATVWDAALFIEGEETEMATAVVSTVEVGVGSFGDEAEASSQEEFWEIFGFFTLEVEGGFLVVVF